MGKTSSYMKRADSLFAALVKERDGFCLYCGSTEYLQCAHIIGRSYKSIRCDFDNAVTLCRACHMRFTHKPLEWEGWIEDRYPGRLAKLREKALRYERVDWKRKVKELS